MAELLIKAINAVHVDPDKDKRGSYKTGMIVEIRPDGCEYGSEEGLPKFVKIKIPLVPVDHPLLEKLMHLQQVQAGFHDDGTTPIMQSVRRRKCWLRYADLPLAARNKFQSDGEVTIKANPEYTGAYDYTWAQVKNYFWDDDEQADMTGDL